VIRVRRLAYVALVVAFGHIVFGAIVRISGSGMGCGENWPKCYGRWFPPLTRPDLIIEVAHRYLAIALLASIIALAIAAWRESRFPAPTALAQRRSVLRWSLAAVALWIAPALLGAVTVFLGNPPAATVAHKALAATLLAVLAATAARAGGFGAGGISRSSVTSSTVRGAAVAAGLAIVAVLLGALTAKLPGAAAACAGFPLCQAGSTGGGAQHVQLAHRIVAYGLALHLLSFAVRVGRRGEPAPVVAASRIAALLVLAQVGLAAVMVLGGFAPVVRSLHQATGMALWLSSFLLAYLTCLGCQTPTAVPYSLVPIPDSLRPTAPALPGPQRAGP